MSKDKAFFEYLKNKTGDEACALISHRNNIRLLRTAKRISNWMSTDEGKKELADRIRSSFDSTVDYPKIIP